MQTNLTTYAPAVVGFYRITGSIVPSDPVDGIIKDLNQFRSQITSQAEDIIILYRHTGAGKSTFLDFLEAILNALLANLSSVCPILLLSLF